MRNFIPKLGIILLLIFSAANLCAQPPGAFYLQGVAKDNQGNPARNRTIHYEISIFQGKPVRDSLVYQESHRVQSNNDGVYELVVGRGIRNTNPPLKDSLSSIDWAKGPFFMNQKIAVAPSIPAPWWIAANNYVDLGTQQILSAVYAIYAGNASITNVNTNIPAGPPNTFLTTDSSGKVNWTPPQAAQVNVTQISNIKLVITSGQDAKIPPNTSVIVKVRVPGAKKGDPILVSPQDDYREWSVYAAWCIIDEEVSVRLANFTPVEVNVLGSQYKIVVIK